jgi:hypothetical protein
VRCDGATLRIAQLHIVEKIVCISKHWIVGRLNPRFQQRFATRHRFVIADVADIWRWRRRAPHFHRITFFAQKLVI